MLSLNFSFLSVDSYDTLHIPSLGTLKLWAADRSVPKAAGPILLTERPIYPQNLCHHPEEGVQD